MSNIVKELVPVLLFSEKITLGNNSAIYQVKFDKGKLTAVAS